MATGASNSELAVLLVDARKGLLEQTRRHAIIASLLGIRYVVLAVNKIDLVDFDRAVFEQISDSFRAFAAELGFKEIVCIPVSARDGDNVSSRSARTPWYAGPHLLEYLEAVDVEDNRAAKPFRMPVQRVNRPNSDFRGFAGTIAGGSVKAGDEIVVLPSGQTTRIKEIIGPQGALERAQAGDAVTVTLTDEIDVAGGDMLAAIARAPAGGRPIRRASDLDVGRPAAAGAVVSDEDQQRDAGGHRDRPQAPDRRQHLRPPCRQDAGAERDRRLQSVGGAAGRLRSLRRQPRHRRLHPASTAIPTRRSPPA